MATAHARRYCWITAVVSRFRNLKARSSRNTGATACQSAVIPGGRLGGSPMTQDCHRLDRLKTEIEGRVVSFGRHESTEAAGARWWRRDVPEFMYGKSGLER